ncbi:hypothetical protein CLF_105386 [Clonorchis sinensis]|uniref:Pol-related protein n=1 Tax=Clonorchis sinensis TaxID=79923 RepID=G7YP87_CLOSI|nr:hypothetical protein CLF_105386 [Clonorchis sinensis]
MIRRTFSRITRTDFQILYGAHVRPLLEYANRVVYSGRTKDVILIERVQRAATKMVAGLKSMNYETRLAVLDLFSLGYRRLRGDLILAYSLFEQGLANRFFNVDTANTRRGHGQNTIRHLFTRVLALTSILLRIRQSPRRDISLMNATDLCRELNSRSLRPQQCELLRKPNYRKMKNTTIEGAQRVVTQKRIKHVLRVVYKVYAATTFLKFLRLSNAPSGTGIGRILHQDWIHTIGQSELGVMLD